MHLNFNQKSKLGLSSLLNLAHIVGKNNLAPAAIAWTVINRCNLTCEHCISHLSREKIDQDKIMEACLKIAKSDTKLVAISGGEPLMVPNIKEVVRELKNGNKIVTINTNAYRIEQHIDWIIDFKVDSVTVSIDGHNAEIHDKIRMKKGAFDSSMSAIKLLKQRRIGNFPHLGIRAVIMKDNYKHIAEYIRNFKDLADDIRFQPVHNHRFFHDVSDESVLLDEEDELSYEEMKQAILNAIKIYPELNNRYFKKIPKYIFESHQMKKEAINHCLPALFFCFKLAS